MRLKPSYLVPAWLLFAHSLQAQPGFQTCEVSVGGRPVAIVASDFDRNGAPDLAVVDQQGSRVVLLRASNSGLPVYDCRAGFEQAAQAIDSSPVAIADGDLDRDGDVDFAVASDGGVTLLRGNGGGTFAASGLISAGANPQAIAIGDVDGDAEPDVVVGNGFGDAITVLYGPDFDPQKSIPFDVGGPVIGLAIADLNDDSFEDVVAITSADEVAVFLHDENAANGLRELPRQRIISAPAALVLAQLTLREAGGNVGIDTIPDLAVVGGGAGKLAIYRGLLGESSSQAFDISNGIVFSDIGASPAAVAALNADLDANLDLLVANQGDDTLPIYLGSNSGNFSLAGALCLDQGARCTAEDGPRAVAIADLDGDGRDDVATANEAAGSITLLLSVPNAPSPTPTDTPPPTPSITPTATPSGTPTMTPSHTPLVTSTPTMPVNTPTATIPVSDCCFAHDYAGCSNIESSSGCRECVQGVDSECFTGVYDERCEQVAKGQCASFCNCPGPTATPVDTVPFTKTPRLTNTPSPTRTATNNTRTIPSRTPTPTFTSTGTLPTSTTTPTLTRTATLTPTQTSKCAGSLQPCVEGESCALDPHAQHSRSALLILSPMLVALLLRRRSLT